MPSAEIEWQAGGRKGTAVPVDLLETDQDGDSFPTCNDMRLPCDATTRAQLVESAGLEGTFAHVISVEEVKTYKPSPAAYRLAVRKLGVDRKDIGFVSSIFWDDASAKAFGFGTYWVNRSSATRDELSVTPDTTLTSLTELVDFVKA